METKPDYQALLIKGEKYQDFIKNQLNKIGIQITYTTTRTEQFISESKEGIEIKFDDQMKNTGNIYLEFMERSDTKYGWTDSGFKKKDNTWLIIIGDYTEAFFFSKETLNDLRIKYRNAHPIIDPSCYGWGDSNNTSRIFDPKTATSHGLCIPKDDPLMKTYCIRYIKF